MTDDGTVVKITAFADDTTGYSNDDDSVNEMFRHMRCYEKASGAQVNETKTVGLRAGNWKGNLANDHDITWLDELIKSLGMMQGVGACEFYWDRQIEKIKNKCAKWSKRKLSFQARVHVIKSEIINSIMYAMRSKVLPEKI